VDQVYTPIQGSLGLSAACAAIPILVLLLALGVFRLSAWKSGLLGLLTSIIVAIAVYGMPSTWCCAPPRTAPRLACSDSMDRILGIGPVRLTVTPASRNHQESVGHLIRTQAAGVTHRIAFGAFIEGASGFGTRLR